MTETGKLYVVGTPIGNLSDFSPRGIETLESVDYIAAEDTRVTLRLLTHFGIKKPLLSYYKPHEAEKSAKILELLHGGNSVALVSDAGMPCISDPGVYLVQRCYEQGVPVESVPCCNAAIAAVAISGIDTARFAFEGFLPVDKKERRQRLAETAKLPHTLIYYEAPHKLRQTLADLAEALGGTRRAALCRELTKLHEEVLRGTLGELRADRPPGRVRHRARGSISGSTGGNVHRAGSGTCKGLRRGRHEAVRGMQDCRAGGGRFPQGTVQITLRRITTGYYRKERNSMKTIHERVQKKIGPTAKVVIPIIGAVIVVAGAVAYICMKLADEMRYHEKWKDYDECGWH